MVDIKQWRDTAPDYIATSLACCMRRARELRPVPHSLSNMAYDDHRNEYYWHTRELCFALSVALGIPFQYMMNAHSDDVPKLRDHQVLSISSEFWIHVVHPDILVQEIMES